MKIYVRGAKGSSLSTGLIKRAAEYYAKELGMTQRLRDKLTLFIKIEKKRFGFSGLCSWFDDPYRPREFEIRILDEGYAESLSTLAHEMVHVKQYATGKLRDLMSIQDMVVWEGARKPLTEEGDSYLSQPWEAEAFSLEKPLMESFLNTLRP